MVEWNPGSNEAEDQIGDACWASTLAWRQADCKPVGMVMDKIWKRKKFFLINHLLTKEEGG